MTVEAKIKSIYIYPIKSLDGVKIDNIAFNRSGGLKNDRVFALKDFNGEYINAKNYPEIIKLRSDFDLDKGQLYLNNANNEYSFNLFDEIAALEEWFSEYFKKKVKLHRNSEMGYPDDRKRPGPTVYSYQSLELVRSWFPDLSLKELRRRFRGNIELDANLKGFWEDELLLSDMKHGLFQLGQIEFQAVKPCPRCPVPTRDSMDGEIYRGFQKNYTEKRKKSVSAVVDKKLFPHYYMFAINTLVSNPESGNIKCGDLLSIH